MRNAVPVAVAFLAGILMVITFFTPEQGTAMGELRSEIFVWGSIVAGFTLLLGVVSLWRVHHRAVATRKSGWGFNLLTLAATVVMALPSLIPADWVPTSIAPLTGRDPGSVYDWLFTYVSTPMSQTMFAILAFFIASAAYRAFRARSLEATLLLVTACLVMFWRVPIGEATLRLISHDLPELINQYIMNGVNMSVQRGIVIGASLGAAANSLRILLGIERTYMGRG